MIRRRVLLNDRPLARDIPGLLEPLFPHLISGVVAHFNRKGYAAKDCAAVPAELIAASALQHAMLFELAVAVAEDLLASGETDWDRSLHLAVERQRRHFDAQIPSSLSQCDKTAASAVAHNLVAILRQLQAEASDAELVRSPAIPGYRWIASGVGDFSIANSLIEVKCSSRPFSSADYRQIVMYWLLGFSASIESGAPEWRDGVLVNPRLNRIVRLPFDQIIDVVGAGKSKVDLLQIFSSVVGSDAVCVD